MKRTKFRKITSFVLATAISASLLLSSITTVYAADSPPMVGDQAQKTNQPGFNGYRVWDIRDWTPEADPGSEFLRAEIPKQDRITPFQATQANPTLNSEAEVMLMQGDYGDAFVDGMMYNNTFNYHALNFWQYTDYFSPWHGAATATSPKDLYDWDLENSDPNGWQKRYFEFGVLNIPNPAYTNAAHKNGVKSIACIYFDQSFRQGQTINELFIQDENGKFPVAEKLIEMAKYFGYDGYFFNAEESVDAKYAASKKQFLARLTQAGLWTQYYDTNSSMNASKADWLLYDINGDGKKEKIQDSVFVNYGWPGAIDKADVNIDFVNKYNLGKATEDPDRIDLFKNVFFGVEANQGKFSGGHPTAKSIPELYLTGTKNPRASVALFTPSDFYQRGDGITGAMQKDPDYQWMIAERERMYFSGVKSDPTNTGYQPGFARPEVNVSDASQWVGVADFASERSVIKGFNFYTDFNTGKGMQYFNNGKVSRDDQWSNITVQDVLPTWQWWVNVPQVEDTKNPGTMIDAGPKLKV
jgi:endo-beta-N-acetylglucosaminidase D